MNMDMYAFNRLTMAEQTRFLWQEATFIERIDDAATTRTLYFANGFFIEATVSHRQNRIVELVTFTTVEPLEKYLESVNLAALII